eukprot:3081632-Rhodomonas_salina.1
MRHLPAYALAMQCPVQTERICLHASYEHTPVLSHRMGIGRSTLCTSNSSKSFPVRPATCLRAYYEIPSTFLAYGPICLRAYYTKTGTDLAYRPTCLCSRCYAMLGTDPAYGPTCLGACYAMSGTELARYEKAQCWRYCCVLYGDNNASVYGDSAAICGGTCALYSHLNR